MRGIARRLGPGLLTGLCLGLLALGPGLRRGFLLSYDMLFVPREPFSAALPGLAPPRAVPSDLVIAAVSRVLPADIVQKLVLLSIFMIACSGVAALLEGRPLLARLAGGVLYTWNPYVGERLIIGQWALLLGYAGLPWVYRAVLGKPIGGPGGPGGTGSPPRRGGIPGGRPPGPARLALALLPAIVGGFAAMTVTALVLVPAAICTLSVRRAALVIGVFAAGTLPWLIPSLVHPVYADPAGVAAFAARADTPFGTIGSLLMLGGMWNAETVPKGYGGSLSSLWLAVVLIALGGFALAGRLAGRDRGGDAGWLALCAGAVAGLLIASIGVTALGRDGLRAATQGWAGFAVFRDGQQFVAPLALAEALGAGVMVAWWMNHGALQAKEKTGRQQPLGSIDAAGVMLGVLAVVAPVVLLPGLAWGVGGRLRPAWYPASWLTVARMINASPTPGAVLVLPWVADRRPAWNHGETLLDPWPRLLSRTVIWNDGTQVGNVKMAPDDPPARALNGLVSGSAPLTSAFRSAGVRFVIDDGDPPDGQVITRLRGCVVRVSEPDLIVCEFSPR